MRLRFLLRNPNEAPSARLRNEGPYSGTLFLRGKAVNIRRIEDMKPIDQDCPTVAVHGSTTAPPRRRKSAVFRVAIVIPCTSRSPLKNVEHPSGVLDLDELRSAIKRGRPSGKFPS